MNRILVWLCSAVFAAPAIGFTVLFWKAAYMTLHSASTGTYRSDVVADVTIFFLLAAAGCGLISFKFFEMARRGFEEK